MLQAEAQAQINAGNNGFSISPSADFYADGNIVATRCVSGSENFIEVRVSITLDTQTSFVHLVYQGPAQNTVDAIARVYPRAPLASGHSIISLTDSCSGGDKGTRFSGNFDVTINGGGIFSNSCIRSDGGTGSVIINDGVANYDQGHPYDGHPTISPAPEPVNYPYKPTFEFPSSCVGDVNPEPDVDPATGAITYFPGRYTDPVTINGNETSPVVTLEPGLYCFTKDTGTDPSPGSFRANGGAITGNGVTFYFTEDAGGFNTDGNGTVKLYPPKEPCDDSLAGYWSEACDPAVPNLLIYMEAGNNNGITLGGGSSSYYEGTVYAETAPVDVGGDHSALSSVGVQVIADTVKVHGNVAMTITYDDSLVYHTPNKLNLEK
jgi:hypothetical protein